MSSRKFANNYVLYMWNDVRNNPEAYPVVLLTSKNRNKVINLRDNLLKCGIDENLLETIYYDENYKFESVE